MTNPDYDLRKLKAILLVAGGVALSVLVLNALLTLSTAAWPNWLPRQFFGVDFIVDNRQRAIAAAAQYRDGTLGRNDPFVLILGLSSASEGISLGGLSTPTANDTRFLGLAGGGRNMRDAARYAGPMINSAAGPELVVLAINSFHLMDPPSTAAAFRDRLRRPETIENLRGYWLVRRRQDVKYIADAGINRLQSTVFATLDAEFPDERDPWRELMRMGLPKMTMEAQWERNVLAYGERGYFDNENYQRSTVQPGFFNATVSAFINRGSSVVVVLMPEHSRLRTRVPDAALKLLLDSAVSAFGSQPPDVVDFRDAIPDSGFNDISHMNEAGRGLFSPMLGDVIAKRLQSIRQDR